VNSFESAFAQLPALVVDWRKQLDGQLVELVKIPSHLSSKDALRGRGRASSTATRIESSPTNADTLRLASVVFKKNDIAAPYPDILFLAFPERIPTRHEGKLASTVSIRDRFGIEFLEEAPYIVHACGLDPNVATAEDLDRRNARLKCLTCNDSWVMNWRNAVRHVFRRYHMKQMASSKLPRFELVSDEYIDAIQAAELSSRGGPAPYRRCLLCCPSVGDAMFYHCIELHLTRRHGMDEGTIQEGVHYATVNMQVEHWRELGQVQMVEEGGKVTFK